MLTYSVEPFSDKLFVEILPLLKEHYDELNKDPGVPLSPDIERYYILAKGGMLHIVTARTEAGALVGYAVNILMRGLHYSTVNFATNDLVFVKKEYRKGLSGIRLLKFMEEELKSLGIHLICMHVKEEPNFGPVLEKMGYKAWETVYKKRVN